MRITFHVHGFYDWEPVPADVKVTPADISAGRIRPSASGVPLMRVPKKMDTHTEVCLSEATIIEQILYAYCDKGKQGVILTRAEAVARYIGDELLQHHTHRSWMHDVEVHDDGPSEELFRAKIAPHLDADHGRAPGKNIEPEDVPALVAAYLTPMDTAAHRDHLHKHFKIKPKESA